MSILDNLKPVKHVKKFDLSAFEDDINLFRSALQYVQKNSKEEGKYTEEILFERLLSPLREDNNLVEFSRRLPKKRPRTSTIKSQT